MNSFLLIRLLVVGFVLLTMVACGSPAEVSSEAVNTTGHKAPHADQPPTASTLSLFRGNAARTGVYPDSGTPLVANSTLLWTYNAPHPIAGAAVVGPQFAFIPLLTYPQLHVIDVQTGKLVFTIERHQSIESLPTIADNVLYYGGDQGLYAMDLSTRTERWVFNTSTAVTSPIVHNGVVFFGQGSAMSDPGSGAVYAVDAATGEERWHVPMDNAVTAEIAITDSIIYVTSDMNHMQGDVVTMHQTLRALDVVTGQEIWTFTMPGVASALMTAPTVYDGIVYVSRSYSADAGTGAIYALDAKTGQQIWTQTTSDGLWNPEPAVAHNGMIYIAASTPRYPRNQGIEAPLYVFDAKTGTEKWTFRHGAVMYAPSIANNMVYVATDIQAGERGAIFVLEPETGKELQKVDIAYSPRAAPTIACGVVYVVAMSSNHFEDVLLAIK